MTGLTLVTGATGFIGRHVVQKLLEEDAIVRVLVRDPARLDPAVRDRVQIVQGDVRDAVSVSASVRGVETVLHLAALACAWTRDPTEFRTVNVDAVERLLTAMERESVSRFVHISSIVTLRPHGTPREQHRFIPLTPYQETKLAGERLVDSYAERGRHAVIVHPTRVYGPGPLNDANGVTKLIALYLRGRLRFRLADRGVLANWVHVADVADGILLAARRAPCGAHYVLGGPENVSFLDLLALVSELGGVHRYVLPLPPKVGLAYGRMAELWGRLGGKVPITHGWVRTFLEDHRVDITPARRDIDYAPRPLRRGVGETIEWLRREGLVKHRGIRFGGWIASPDPRVS